MSELRKANTDHPFFMTCTVVGWIDVFTRSTYADVIVETLKFSREKKGMKIFAYVIMPNHIHFIAQHKGSQLGKIIGEFKSYTAQAILSAIESSDIESRKSWLQHLFKYYARFEKSSKHRAFWDTANHPIELTSTDIFFQKLEYIELNPVKAGYVNDEKAWVYSSACMDSPLKMNEF